MIRDAIAIKPDCGGAELSRTKLAGALGVQSGESATGIQDVGGAGLSWGGVGGALMGAAGLGLAELRSAGLGRI